MPAVAKQLHTLSSLPEAYSEDSQASAQASWITPLAPVISTATSTPCGYRSRMERCRSQNSFNSSRKLLQRRDKDFFRAASSPPETSRGMPPNLTCPSRACKAPSALVLEMGILGLNCTAVFRRSGCVSRQKTLPRSCRTTSVSLL